VNLAGEVIGVNTSILSSSGDNSGIGFAVPSNTAIQVYNQLIEHGRVTRGALGISMQNEASPQALKALGATDGKGVIVQQVRPKDGPADRAGLQPGDVIVGFKGRKIGEPADIYPMLSEIPPGETVEVEYLRDGRKRTARLTVGDRAEVFSEESVAQSEPGQEPDSLKLGLRVQGLSPQWKRHLGAEAEGVLIVQVESGSVADDAGLRSGDVLLELNKVAVASPARLAKLAGELQPGTDVLFLVRRGQPASGETVALYLAATLP
jgi:serine protease Do